MFAVVCPNLYVSHLALDLYKEVTLPAYPIDLEQALSVRPLLEWCVLDH